MPGRNLFAYCLVAPVLVVLLIGDALAAQPSELLLPRTTKAFVSVPDVGQLDTSWNKTQLGQLVNDPLMQPFVEDIKAQIRANWGNEYESLGLTLDDLKGVPGGEVSLARIQPGAGESAVVILVDITDHQEQADALLKKVDKGLLEKKATKNTEKVQGTNVITYTIPDDEDEKKERLAVFFINDNILCAADHVQVAKDILGRFSGEPTDNLASLPAFRAVMDRAAEASGELAPELRWFIEPFGYVATVRAADPSRQKKGKDMVKILAGQGFDAVQGVGGHLNFYVEGRYEIIHRTLLYAPAVEGAAEGEKYKLAARMLRFPNQGDLQPQEWIPRDLAAYVSFNWEIKQAFEYASTLVDAIVGEEGVFEEIIESLRDDPNGPQIDLREDLVAHLGTRCTLFTDYVLPITPKCERMVFAVDSTNPQALAATIEKTMKSDPDARRIEFEGHTIFEIVEEEEALPELKVEIPQFGDFGAEEEEVEEEKAKLPNSAVCVANGHMFISTHIEFLKKVLAAQEQREQLGQAVDYQLVMEELGKISAETNCFRIFSRTDEEYRPTYELIRSGKMPESETLLGKLLNGILGEGKEGELRHQRIDGEKLPSYEMVRRYLGPAGVSIHAEENGWFVQGISLSKQSP